MNNLAETNSLFRSGTDISNNYSDVDTLMVDLWGTVARSDNREPIRNLQEILGYKVKSIDHNDVRSVDLEFLDICLTTDEADPVRFAHLVAGHFGITVTPEMVEQFQKVIADEATCSGIFFDAKAALKTLKARGYKLVLASNLWPFPVPCLFQEDNLGKYFPEHLRAYSYREGVSKPDSHFFSKALVRGQTTSQRTLMIGDHLENDILAAREKGIRTCLIDRNGKYRNDARVPGDVLHLTSMEQLLDYLPDRTQAAAPAISSGENL
jgi:FMN phosphatase YigB (HAD superfamily)